MDHIILEKTLPLSGAAIKAFDFTFPPHTTCMRAHWHERIEFLYIHEGEMTIDLGSDSFTATEGQLIIIPPKMPHYGVTDEVAVHYDVLQFDISMFYNNTPACQKLLKLLHEGSTVMQHVTTHEEIIRCVDALCHKLDQDSILSVAMVYQLLNNILEHCLLSINPSKEAGLARDIAAYIEDHYTQDIDSAQLSHRFGYTTAHLCRKFKAATGLTPMNYLKIYRLEQAHKAIVNSDDSIGEIAARCGYSDSNYFTRCYTAHFGMPPTHYRKSKTNIH